MNREREGDGRGGEYTLGHGGLSWTGLEYLGARIYRVTLIRGIIKVGVFLSYRYRESLKLPMSYNGLSL